MDRSRLLEFVIAPKPTKPPRLDCFCKSKNSLKQLFRAVSRYHMFNVIHFFSGHKNVEHLRVSANRPWWLSSLERVSNSSIHSLGRRFESRLRHQIWMNLYGRIYQANSLSLVIVVPLNLLTNLPSTSEILHKEFYQPMKLQRYPVTVSWQKVKIGQV